MTTIRKPSIPSTHFLQGEMSRLMSPIKENLEIITGVRGGQLTALSDTASTAEIITAINAIIAKLNVSGS